MSASAVVASMSFVSSWAAEAPEGFGRAEGGDLFNPRGLEGEHDDGFGFDGAHLLIPAVARNGKLAVGAGREDLPALS